MPIRKKPYGQWFVDITHEGKRYRLNSPENTQRGARAYERVLLTRISNGLPLQGEEIRESIKYATYFEQWMKTHVATNNKKSGQDTKRSIGNSHLIPYFGHMYIDDITTLTVEQFKTAKQEHGLSSKTINNILACLRTSLNHACEWDVIDKVPKIKALRLGEQKTNFLQADELQKLLARTEEPLYQAMIRLAANTGLRYGELSGLKWTDIDFTKRELTVRHNIVNGRLTTPKSGKTRDIPLNDEALNAIDSVEPQGEYVFMTDKGTPVYDNRALIALKRICEKAGIRKITWHVLRHTFATNVALSGVPLHVLQKLMGHSTIKMTERYSHASDQSLKDAVNMLQLHTKQNTLGSIWALSSQPRKEAFVRERTFPNKTKEK